MPRLRHRFIFVALLALCAVATAAPSSAAVQVRVGVRPDTLVHCGRGQLTFALWNDGEDPLRVKVYVSITHGDSTEIGPRVFRAPLEPHQLVRREATFFVPPALPTGRYALRVLAVASDSSRTEAVAPFVVMPSECSIGDPLMAPSLLLDGIGEGLGLDVSTPAIRGTWGAIKRRYDSKPR